jgi:hypothetical protein
MLITPLYTCLSRITAPPAPAAKLSTARTVKTATLADGSVVTPIGSRLALSPQPVSKLLSNGHTAAFNGNFSAVLQLQPVTGGDERRASATSTGSSSGSSNRRFAFGQQQHLDDSFATAAATAAADSIGERDSVMSSNDDLVSFLEQTGSILALAQVHSYIHTYSEVYIFASATTSTTVTVHERSNQLPSYR